VTDDTREWKKQKFEINIEREKKNKENMSQLFAITPTSNQDIKILYNMFQPTTGFSLGSKSENINGEERKTNIR
jgi:hypothetical protein